MISHPISILFTFGLFSSSLWLINGQIGSNEAAQEALAQLQATNLDQSGSSISSEKTLELLQELANNDPESSVGAGVKVVDLIGLSSLELAKCSESHFRQLVDWRKQLRQAPVLLAHIKHAITSQRLFCEKYLDEQVDLRLASFSALTRHFFELFLKHDKIGEDFYVSLESSVLKLRELLQEAEQRQQRGLLSSCHEITGQLEDLMPIRKDHDIFARLPLTRDRYFRAYEFCQKLVNVDFSEEIARSLLLDVRSRTEITHFGVYLAVHRLSNLDEDEREALSRREQVLEAARSYVRVRLPASASKQVKAMDVADKRASEILERLRVACASSLDLTESTRWLRSISTSISSTKLTPRAVEYLRALEGCAYLLNLSPVEVLVRATPPNQAAGQDDEEPLKDQKKKETTYRRRFMDYLIKEILNQKK